jgi:hypothetical protein
MKGVDIVDIEVDIYIDNIDRTGEGTRERQTAMVRYSNACAEEIRAGEYVL